MYPPLRRLVSPLPTMRGGARSLALGTILVTGVVCGMGCSDVSDVAATQRAVVDPHVRATSVSAESERPVSRHRLLLAPRREARVAARYGGAVASLEVQEQDAVVASQVIVELVGTEAQGGLRAARAAVAEARERLEDNARVLARSERLEATGAESSREVERLRSSAVGLEAALGQAKGALVQAQDRVDGTRVRAPFDGTVTSMDVEVGEYAPMGGTVAVVSELSTLALEVPLSESEAVAQERGALTFLVEVRGQPTPHEVAWVSARAKDSSATFTARLLLENGAGSLRAGETALVRVESPRGPNAPAVPPEALRWDGARPFVLRLERTGAQRAVVRRVDVKVLGDLGRRVAIEGIEGQDPVGLGMQVVAAGPDNLRDGDEVVVVGASLGPDEAGATTP